MNRAGGLLELVARGKKDVFFTANPTTGLHWDDIAKLLKLLGRLRDAGATLIVIEHQSDVILAADWAIELGPTGGKEGGQIIFEGAPEDLKKSKESPTGRALKN